MERQPISREGYDKLRAEIQELEDQKPDILERIKLAREEGDLKENAEYHAAREQQGFCEGRIQEIEGKLGNAQIIDLAKMAEGTKVIFGSTVDILNLDTDKLQTYKIVGDDEADVKANMISISSPIARALIGKEVGDVALVRTPAGEVEYEIDAVRYH